MRPCPVRIRTRRVYVGESDSAPLRSVYVRDLTLQAGVNRARRGPALASPVDAGRADEWYGETWSFEITQELYASYDEHDVLLRACAMTVTSIDDDDLRRYTPAAHARSARTPCYIEIIEIGGNVLRATDCVGTVRLSADPADIPRLVFSMTGRFLEPVDAPAIPITPRVGARPVLYRNADLYVDDIGLITCPAVEFETGGSVYETPELHRPSGVALDSYHDTTARLTLDGTLTARESSQLVWSVRRGEELTLALPDDEVELSLYDWTIDPPAHTTEGPFLAYALTFRADSWSLTLPRDRSLDVPPTINPVGEDINGTRYVFTESVEVTGTATPDSVITVNGQSVSVDSDGLWATTVTLTEGSNTITAIGADGQIAQAEVVFFGEQSVLALGPPVWLDPSDMATLFVDAAGATPVQFSGDPVGLWKNKGTFGSVGDAAQPVSASRPTWTDAGGGMLVGNGELITSDATRISPPRSVAIYAGSTPTGTPAKDIAGWKRGAGYDDDLAFYIRSSRESVWRIPRNLDLSDAANVSLIIESASGLIVGKTLSSTEVNMVPPRGQFSTPFRVMPDSGNFVGHVLIFDRELTEEESTKLLAWLEANND